MVGDDDNGTGIEYTLAWNGDLQDYESTSAFGDLIFGTLSCGCISLYNETIGDVVLRSPTDMPTTYVATYELFNDEAIVEYDTAEVFITVYPYTNTDPVVVNDTLNATTPQDTSITICVNATDIDGDTIGICDINPMPANGIVTNYTDSTLCFTYTPDSSFVGNDTVTVIICDGNGGSDTVVIIIGVTPVLGEGPIAVNDNDTATTDTLTIDILVNDENVNDSTTVEIITDPIGGTATLDSNNNLIYVPDLDFCGLDSLSYQICNETGCDTAMVYITVFPADSDNDGIPNYIETLTADTDGDGILNYLDLDSDGDAIPDSIEALGDLSDPCNPIIADTDGDGTPDYLDLDSDNDDISDKEENDIDGDGIGPDDSDGNGIPDYRDPNTELDIPEGFSPNGDNVNDNFFIKGINTYEVNTLTIYNRWGNKVYEASPYNNDWDGKNMYGVSIGNDLPVGTYFYIIQLNGDSSNYKRGYIYLNR